ncbi:NADH-quinone oxidoreductase subunit NuoF [Desulfatirhabdium butyrativorans]|uniref:NADH-quinone oxidoreductase subunit NuoF n=1 Tax=Desulfatirhabdium butyrativorans TaxID=340467 RepID=UPI0004223BE5|nr:NADH-quinone oxidoreductase subunit NuoF [Desulfatirhabdium butyrativorans]
MSNLTMIDLMRIKEKAVQELESDQTLRLMVCGGTGCHATGSINLKIALEAEIEKRGLQDKARVIETGCNGFCAMGPILVVQPGGIFYQKVHGPDVPELIEQQVVVGKPLERLLYKDPVTKKPIVFQHDIPFFAHQNAIALRNKGMIDPENIEHYIARDGYFGTAKALLELETADIIAEVKLSGLRGRGGAGFPTGVKWDFASKSPGEIKYVLCNADEGDPGAFMDRSILEADPHAVLEGMIIASKAIGSHQGYIYARTEYPLAIRRLEIAIRQAREMGLLGKNILGSGHDFDIEIYQGAGAFVCGEETALMRSIEGKRGMPRPRPPFPAQKGLWEKPTILNNVETFANIAQIIVNGGAWYAAIGTETSKGTKVFAMSGDIYNIGLVEIPMGTTLRKLIYDIGGGIPNKKKFKAVQLGGPSGGCVPEAYLDTLIDYEEIAKVGAIMGSGGAIVMNQNTCMVDMARFFMDFIQDESCGKCTPCREGTRRLLEILKKICAGEGEPEDIDKLEALSATIKETALCGLGQTGPNPVLSTLRYFKDEYYAHIYEKRCPAKRCVALLKFEIDPEICTQCGSCFRSCPAQAIEWQKKQPARIDKTKCIQCMTCFDKCKFDAIF